VTPKSETSNKKLIGEYAWLSDHPLMVSMMRMSILTSSSPFCFLLFLFVCLLAFHLLLLPLLSHCTLYTLSFHHCSYFEGEKGKGTFYGSGSGSSGSSSSSDDSSDSSDDSDSDTESDGSVSDASGRDDSDDSTSEDESEGSDDSDDSDYSDGSSDSESSTDSEAERRERARQQMAMAKKTGGTLARGFRKVAQGGSSHSTAHAVENLVDEDPRASSNAGNDLAGFLAGDNTAAGTGVDILGDHKNSNNDEDLLGFMGGVSGVGSASNTLQNNTNSAYDAFDMLGGHDDGKTAVEGGSGGDGGGLLDLMAPESNANSENGGGGSSSGGLI
jgi:hypothetical protein